MNFNPPPVIVLYKQTLNEDSKKNYSKLWQQEPDEVKQFFSNLFQVLKTSKATGIFFDSETDKLSDVSEIQQKMNYSFFSESSNSIVDILNGLDYNALPSQSAFLDEHSINSIEQLCQKMKAITLDQSLQVKIDQSFMSLSKLRK